MAALTTFCNTDSRALQIAHELHRSENPSLTILFGSRARGDFAEGRSDVDIMLVQEEPPTKEQAKRVDLQSLSLSTSLYRGYPVRVNVVWQTLDEFDRRRRGINALEARAVDHGIILSNINRDYGTWSRRAKTSYFVRKAELHLGFLLERKEGRQLGDSRSGNRAFLAMQSALKAVVYASGEWCPEVEDIGMLNDFAARADTEFTFRPGVDVDVYSQYSSLREGLPIERPLLGIANYRSMVEGDVRTILTRVQTVRESWTVLGS